ncbi:hypothetical protein MC885_000998 [Smutsia gigantea]|nr:hypothetical protein MC885_000998 [Smutsia gigantea]
MATWMGADGCQQRRRMEKWLGRGPRSATAERSGAACLLGVVGVECGGLGDQGLNPKDKSWILSPGSLPSSPGTQQPSATGLQPAREAGQVGAFQDWLEEAALGKMDTCVVDMLCGLKMRLKRRQASLALPEHHEAFKSLLEDPVVKSFLAWDKNLRVSNKYLLAMVIAYFSPGGLCLSSRQYQPIHFFIAL